MVAEPCLNKSTLHQISLLILIAGALCGCTSVPLNTARGFYRQGNFDQAAETLEGQKPADRDQVLFYMERGSIRQAAGNLEGSSGDFIRAVDIKEDLEKLNISKGASSMVINDSLNDYLGRPYEQALLHTMTALNHLASGRRDDAGVEARRLFAFFEDQPEKKDFELPFAWYITGLALELGNDQSNANIAYSRAVDDLPKPGNKELVCVVLQGSAPPSPQHLYGGGPPPLASLYVDGEYLGAFSPFANSYALASQAIQREAAATAAKAVTRIILKEGIALGVEASTDNEALADLIRIILIGILERPDNRIWSTLPQWFMVERISLDQDPTTIEVRLGDGRTLAPLAAPVRYGDLWFALVRVP